MHKAELIDAVINVTALPRAQVDAVCNALLEAIMNSTAAGEKITLPGFGTFQAKARDARQGRNPATGEPMQIAASRVVGFKAGVGYKQLVASGNHPRTATASTPAISATPTGTTNRQATAKPTAAKAQPKKATSKSDGTARRGRTLQP